MSGGSWDYLGQRAGYHDLEFLGSRLADIERMGERLAKELGASHPATLATKRVSSLFNQALDEATAVSDVWFAVEWFDSGDWSRERIGEAAEAFLLAQSDSAKSSCQQLGSAVFGS